MPISGMEQPMLIQIDDDLRLRKFDGVFAFALAWYRDEATVWMVDGVHQPYTPKKLERMYRYLDSHGELYWIELCDGEGYRPIGDVTFSQQDMPIVIGDKALRGKGIGRKVIQALIGRARALGWRELHVAEIYDWNPASRRCFESLCFTADGKTGKGQSYKLCL